MNGDWEVFILLIFAKLNTEGGVTSKYFWLNNVNSINEYNNVTKSIILKLFLVYLICLSKNRLNYKLFEKGEHEY